MKIILTLIIILNISIGNSQVDSLDTSSKNMRLKFFYFKAYFKGYREATAYIGEKSYDLEVRYNFTNKNKILIPALGKIKMTEVDSIYVYIEERNNSSYMIYNNVFVKKYNGSNKLVNIGKKKKLLGKCVIGEVTSYIENKHIAYNFYAQKKDSSFAVLLGKYTMQHTPGFADAYGGRDRINSDVCKKKLFKKSASLFFKDNEKIVNDIQEDKYDCLNVDVITRIYNKDLLDNK